MNSGVSSGGLRTCIVIPTYNERGNISALVKSVYEAVGSGTEVCVVDDNSPDGTADDVRALQGIYPTLRLMVREKKEGLGKAYVYAFRELLKAGGFECLITMDADFSHPTSALPALMEAAKSHDVVVGSRYVTGGETAGWEMWRKLLSWGGNLYCSIILETPIRDMTAGFVAYRTSCLKKIDLENIAASGYAFQIEMKYVLLRNGASCTEVPITFTNRVNGESKLAGHIISEGILTPLMLRFRSFKKK